MFGLGKNDNNQRAAVEKFKNAMVPLHGGYIFRLKRDGDTVLLTEAQRDILLDFYAALLSRSMRQMVGVLIVGVALLVGAGTVWHFGMHFWAVMILILIAFAPILAINRQMRAKVQEFGTLPIVPSNQVAALSRERLRKMPWATLFAPLGGLFYLRMRPHFPPRDADDWTEIVVLTALVAVFLWAALKKLRADRSAAS